MNILFKYYYDLKNVLILYINLKIHDVFKDFQCFYNNSLCNNKLKDYSYLKYESNILIILGDISSSL